MSKFTKEKWVLILLTFVSVCQSNCLAFNGSGSIVSGGRTRSFVFYAPGTTVSSNLPLLLMFHGDGSNGAAIRANSEFDAVADAGNFMVVYPDADTEGWNRQVDQTKDIQFVSNLIDYFCSTYHIDARKVYASGHSAGGFMAYNLAMNLANKIAAFAPVAGSMYTDTAPYNYNTYFASPSFIPVPIFHIHGDPDPTVPYPDRTGTPSDWDQWPLTQFSYFVCAKKTYTAPIPVVNRVTRLTFCDGTETKGKEIYLMRVTGVGHGWPKVTGFNPAQAIWDFVKNYSLSSVQTCAAVPEEPTFAAGTIHSEGRNIISPCNETFIPRGVNYSLADDWEFPANMDGDPTHVNDELSAEIIKAKPNTVRIEWYANRDPNFHSYTVADLEKVVARFEHAGIVSVIDLHDVTCSNDYAKFNNTILPWWKQQSVKDLLANHKGFVIANIANEFGEVNWASDATAAYNTWLNHYKTVITGLRSAGIEVPLMIDAPDCGQNLDIALQAGPALMTQDPLKNIIMSVHAYWYLNDAAAMEARAVQIANANFPILLGEIANVQDGNTACQYPISHYTDLLQSCQNHQIGWLAWTWTDDWCDGNNGRRISKNGSFTDLSIYGNVIINNPNFGLATHAAKMGVACLGGPLPVKLTSFRAVQAEVSGILLEWTTDQEATFRGFELERGTDGKNFRQIATIAGKGDSQRNHYAYTDQDLTEETYYYRLKMVDTDGRFSYSRIVSSPENLSRQISVYPSPTNDFIQIKAHESNFPAHLKITNLAGITVISEMLEKADQKVAITGLEPGVYFVTLKDKTIGKVIVGGR